MNYRAKKFTFEEDFLLIFSVLIKNLIYFVAKGSGDHKKYFTAIRHQIKFNIKIYIKKVIKAH